MTFVLTLADLGEETEKLLVVEWFLSEGMVVNKGQDLLDVETDKAALTVPSPVTGTLRRVLVGEGEEILRDTPLCEIVLG